MVVNETLVTIQAYRSRKQENWDTKMAQHRQYVKAYISIKGNTNFKENHLRKSCISIKGNINFKENHIRTEGI